MSTNRVRGVVMRRLKVLAGYVLAISLALVPVQHFETQASVKRADTPARTNIPATARYRLDASQSKFIAHALRGGLLWFKGHDHLVAARDFSGEAEITAGSINPASLSLLVKSDSMAETNTV